MANSTSENLAALAQWTDKVALELVFAEAGKDNGLLPVNNLLSQMEELCAATPPPPAVGEALRAARQCVDNVFESGLFTREAIDRLTAWASWMQAALPAATTGRPLPAFPAALGAATAAAPAPVPPAPAPVEAAAEDPLVLALDTDAELLGEFTNESQEHLQNIELGVLTLEEAPTDADTLSSIFRAFHTFKGGSGFLNLRPINKLAHELESLLDLARQHKLTIDSTVINVILSGGDTLKQFVTEIQLQLTGQKPPGQILIPTQPLLARIRAVVDGRPAPAPAGAAAPTVPAPAPNVVALPAAPVAPAAPAAAVAPTDSAKPSAAVSTVKVDTQKLDGLVDLVGEMVIAQSMVAQDSQFAAAASQSVSRNLAQLGRITRELQRTAMSLRMVPVRSTFQKMTRLVRDVAVKSGKQVELQMSGEDTELDRTITEEISDPLVHMIRNSVDHGIEKPDVRVKHGKPALGTVWLRAFHQGGNIVIQIQDDGAGLNKERILAKAVQQGLAKPGEVLSDREIFNFVFAAGFSTAEKVTDLSGRGVGMDVVRKNIDKLRGKIDIESTPGRGSTFTIYLPLTLAIIDGLLVSVGGQRYILPTLAVRESFRPTAGMISTVHERGEMVNVRGRLSPLLRLHEYFDVKPESADPLQAIVIVVESGEDLRCLMVDQLLGKQEVVIKSLGESFKQNPALAGAAILGDGRVGLILDVNTLVKLKHSPLQRAA